MATSINKLLERMTAVENEKIDRDFLTVIYGELGTGKTTLLGGIAQKIKGSGSIIFADSAQDAVSLDNIKTLKRDMHRIPIADSTELPVLAAALKARKNPIMAEARVLILSEFDTWFEQILHRFVRDKHGIAETEELPEIEGKDYNVPTQIALDIVNKFLAIPDLHILICVHEQDRGKAPRTFMAPSLPPKLMRGINQKVHVVGRVEAIIKADNSYDRTVQINPSKTVMAKSRIGGLGVKVPFNDLPGIVANWLGDEEKFVADVSAPEPDPDVEDEDENYEGQALTDADTPDEEDLDGVTEVE